MAPARNALCAGRPKLNHRPRPRCCRDNFLFGYKQDDDHKPHEILRIDDALLEKYGATDSQHISITPIHDRKEPYSLQMESEEQLRVWYAKLLVAVEWWADNKLKRSRVETAARESR